QCEAAAERGALPTRLEELPVSQAQVQALPGDVDRRARRAGRLAQDGVARFNAYGNAQRAQAQSGPVGEGHLRQTAAFMPGRVSPLQSVGVRAALRRGVETIGAAAP